MRDRPRAVALDLGTTRVKAGFLDATGHMEVRANLPAPPLEVRGVEVTSDADAWVRVAGAALANVLEETGKVSLPLGLSCQRSSFLLWDAATGHPRTPLVSWQDRSAAAWCQAHVEAESWIRPLTGLRLSPHYAGPKLAALLERHAAWRAELASGALSFGTLESFLIQSWSGGSTRVTDLSMAARTLLADPLQGSWSSRLLQFFDVPAAALPRLVPTSGREDELTNGLRCAASVADQAAAALALFRPGREDLLVNLGTGGFVLRSTGDRFRPRAGYLAGPLRGGATPLFALEGTINGGAREADAQAAGPTALPAVDPSPEAFCFPDEAGAGAPRWNPAARFTLSDAALALPAADRRRVVLEGLVFRIREISDDLQSDSDVDRVLLSGGLAQDPFVGTALAACLGRDIDVVLDGETSLLGAARLAAGIEEPSHVATRRVPAPREEHWLRAKYQRWRAWVG